MTQFIWSHQSRLCEVKNLEYYFKLCPYFIILKIKEVPVFGQKC